MTDQTRCAENVYTLRKQGPCGNKAKFLARIPGIHGMDEWTPLCGTHANTDRWANYVGTEYRTL